jgi:hypothetical protein
MKTIFLKTNFKTDLKDQLAAAVVMFSLIAAVLAIGTVMTPSAHAIGATPIVQMDAIIVTAKRMPIETMAAIVVTAPRVVQSHGFLASSHGNSVSKT